MIRVSDAEVCTKNLDDRPDAPWGGHGRTNCFETSDEYTEWNELDLEVGDCVNLNVHHPVLVIESEAPCSN